MDNIDKIIYFSDEENDDEFIRIDQFLADYYEDISRSKISTLIKNQDILVNDEKIKPSYILRDKDSIKVNLSKLKIPELKAEDLPIDIIYQDEDLVIINKPFEIISHPTNTIRNGTVVNFLLKHFENLPDINGNDRLGIVHRLDRNTSGLMMIALNEISMIKLKDIFKNRAIIKKYRAIVNGRMEVKEGVIELPIARSSRNRKLMTVSDDGKYAKTSYKVIIENEDYSLLDITLHTGRTHQIRVHMAHISHPIVGDNDYNKIKSNFNLAHQLLQAYYLEFVHPVKKEKLIFEIKPYPEFIKYSNIIFKEKVWENM